MSDVCMSSMQTVRHVTNLGNSRMQKFFREPLRGYRYGGGMGD